MTKSEDLSVYEEYLSSHELRDFQYTTGLFQNGITIYKQQIRALNLFYALFKTGRLKKGDSVCVVGGGVAGLTFSAACLKADVEVLLLEKELIFLPLQHGCDTRVVHPYLYNWPNKGSLFPFTRLPVLAWRADTAANVAKQIFQGFVQILKDIDEEQKNNDTKRDKFKGCVNVPVDQYRPSFNSHPAYPKRFEIRTKGQIFKFEALEEQNTKLRQAEFADVIIYCTGFGIEVSCRGHKITPSYWRNDEYGQMVVNGKTTFHISGLGDGALIDLFRLKILGFSYDFFIYKHKSLPLEQERTKALIELKKIFDEKEDGSPAFYHSKFDEIKPLLDPLINSLFDYRRTNIDVTFSAFRKGAATLRDNELIDLKKISFINALIFYLLTASNVDARERAKTQWYNLSPGEIVERKRKSKILYVVESRDKNNKKVTADINEDAILIRRHGTDRFTAFDETTIPTDVLKKLEKKQKASKVFNSDSPLWKYDDITSLFVAPKERAFCTHETVTLCSTFTSILSRAIDAVSIVDDADFKLCLFRVIDAGNGLNFQTITPYFGSKDSSGTVGEIFPYDVGPLGMSAALREPLLLMRDEEELPSILEQLDIKSEDIFPQSKSVLIIPILGRLEGDRYATNLLLCVDSKLPNFFDDENVINTIINTTDGWIESIDKFVGTTILMDDVLFDPIVELPEIQRNTYEKLKLLRSFTIFDEKTKSTLESIMPTNDPLSFESFYSFDIYHNILR